MLSFAGETRRAVAVPLGGIGTGTVALRADGSHDQWQLGNTINHRAPAPDTLLALRAAAIGSGRTTDHAVRVLRSDPGRPPNPPQDSTDWIAPAPATGAPGWPGMAGSTAEVSYPFVRLAFADDAVPVTVRVEAYTPFVPTDVDASSLPLAEYRVELTSTARLPLFGFVVFVAQNTAGWDGAGPVDGVVHGGYGGNVNRLVRDGATTAVCMDNPGLPDDHPFAGEQVLWTDAPCYPIARADGVASVLRAVESLALIDAAGLRDWSDARLRSNLERLTAPALVPYGPSPAGRTWDAALCAAWALEPGERTTVRFVHAWRFPNRYVDFLQQHVDAGPGGRRLWVGNHYSTRFGTAWEALRRFRDDEPALRGASRAWADAVDGSDLAPVVRDQVTRQGAGIRTPVTFRTADGRYYGHEGGNGASTAYWSGAVGGSCPLNCSHVWNYAQAVSRLFPDLERTMRETEWATQAPSGHLPHRVVLPRWLAQDPDRPIGGPLEPALDGMLGAVLKTYREARTGGGLELLERYWDRLGRLVEHVEHGWHHRDDGILRGPQPSTFDHPLTGPNMFIGSLWLAALAAMREIAGLVGDPPAEARFTQLFTVASRAYDDLLWNGEYYAQADPAPELDYGTGCLADQLVGQWWAHQLELGHLLDPERVRLALRAVLTHNDRRRLTLPDLGARTFADGAGAAGDGGLVNCSWPRGGRPERPVNYCDESWTGTEYQVAAHCLMEGMTAEAHGLLAAVHARHDGSRRNPFNEIECGDHYVRAMSGWTVLEAATGFRYDGIRRRLTIGAGAGRVPFVAATGWGIVTADGSRASLSVRHGTVEVDTVRVGPTEHDVRGTALRAGDVLDVGPAGGDADRDADTASEATEEVRWVHT